MEQRNKVMGKIAVLFSGQGAQYVGTVSYTHLDVYKRQVVH